MSDDPYRMHVLRVLDWEDAHVGFDAAVSDIPSNIRGRQAPGLPYSPWQLLEHMRIAQHDIFDRSKLSRFSDGSAAHHEQEDFNIG